VLLKAGQYIGTRADRIPEPYVRRLERLQDRVRWHPYAVVRQVIEEELGATPEAAFSRIWRRPIASASLAQVHRATLHDGTEVAVKVQRPEVAASVRADLRNLRFAARWLERLEGDLGFGVLLDELEQTLERELDFELEARNAERFARCFSDDPEIAIPATVPRLTRRRLLVTEYLPGIKITDRRRLARADIEPQALVDVLVRSYSRQLLDHRFFHADPHPGNLLVLPQPGGFRLALIDFGLAQEVPANFRTAAGTLAAALFSGEREPAAQALRDLGLHTRDPESDTVERVAEALIEHMRRRAAGRASTHELGERIAALLREDPLASVPPHLWLGARVLGMLAGLASSLGVKLDPLRVLLPFLGGRS
jgi:predicted unusual protein kinase regulating ubiquinone biosynthesis (AarF/ABC1/UbiB family)